MDIVAMPQLGETVTEGTITAWAKHVGERIEVDDTLFEVSTEKVDTEVPAAVDGFLRHILVEEGETVPVGAPVAIITSTADEPFDTTERDLVFRSNPAPAGPARRDDLAANVGIGPAEPVPDRDGTASGPASSVQGSEGATVRSPVVRRLLEERGLTSDDVVGSGRDGRITRADVLAAAAQRSRSSASTAPGSAHGPLVSEHSVAASSAAAVAGQGLVAHEGYIVEMSRARLATAAHLTHSLAEAAHALVVVQVDYSAVDRVRATVGLSYLPFVARAVIDAIAEFPHVNASMDGDRLLVHRAVHLGIAVDVDGEALMVPVIDGADGLRLQALSAAIATVADQARRHRLDPVALSGGTFTITNVGAYGTLHTAPIINQPQVAICSTDGVRMTPIAVPTDANGPGTEWGVSVRPVGNLSLSFDHRALDGAYAAAFLAQVRKTLETRDWSQELDR